MPRAALVPVLGLTAVTACSRGKAGAPEQGRSPGIVMSRAARSPHPDEMPALVNAELPFRYPPRLYAQRAQGNVTLKLFIDRDGRVSPDSTEIAEPSGFATLDSAALAGASELRFVPAKLHGEPIPITILFPVYFRHPEARPLPGDTVLQAARAKAKD